MGCERPWGPLGPCPFGGGGEGSQALPSPLRGAESCVPGLSVWQRS